MNLFLKKNIFIETNRSNSTSSIQSFQLNKLATKNSTSKIENASLLNNFHIIKDNIIYNSDSLINFQHKLLIYNHIIIYSKIYY